MSKRAWSAVCMTACVIVIVAAGTPLLAALFEHLDHLFR